MSKPKIILFDIEQWSDIEGYEGFYQISNIGNVRSLDRIVTQQNRWGQTLRYTKRGKRLSPGSSPNGYVIVGLSKNHVKKYHSVHRLVATAFIPNTDNKPQINHINGVKADNRTENLEWCDASENQIHAYAKGLSTVKKGINVNGAKLDDFQIFTIRSIAKDLSVEVISEYFKISKGHTKDIISGRRRPNLILQQ